MRTKLFQRCHRRHFALKGMFDALPEDVDRIISEDIVEYDNVA